MRFGLRVYLIGTAAGLTATGLSLAAGVANLWMLTRILGTEQFASYVFAMTLTFWLSVIGTAGLDRTVLFRLAGLDAVPGELAGGPIVAAALRFVLASSSMLAVVLALVGVLLGDHSSLPNLSFWLPSLAPVAVLGCLGSVFGAWYSARQRVGTALLVPAIGEITRTLCLALALLILPTRFGVVIAVLTAAIVPLCIWLGIAPLRALRPEALRREDFRYGFKCALSLAAFEGIHQLDVVLVGLLASPLATGHYAVASRMAGLLALGRMTFGQVLGPRMGQYSATSDRRSLLREYNQVRLAALLIAIVGTALFAMYGSPLLRLFGEYQASFPLLMILAASVIIDMGFGFNVTYLDMTGRAGWTLSARLMMLVGLVVLNVVLIPLLGAAGAAVSKMILLTFSNVLMCWMIWNLDGLATLSVGVAVLLVLAAGLPLLVAQCALVAPLSALGLLVLAGILLATQQPLWRPLAKDLIGILIRSARRG